MEKGDTFTKFGQSPEATDEIFYDLSPEELQKLLDKEEAERLGQSISLREFERSGILHSSSVKKKGFQDFSMGAYFENRSSYPFPSLNGNVTVIDDPPQASVAERTTELQASFAQSMDEQNGSINSLVQFFADPEKSPMSSSAIMDHVLDYCKKRSSSHSSNFTRIQKITQKDPVQIKQNVKTNQIIRRQIDDIEVSRSQSESDNCSVFSRVSSSKILPNRSFLDESPQRESEAYRNFSQPLIQKLKKNSRQEKSPTTNVNVMQVVQQRSQQQQLDNQQPSFQTLTQYDLPVKGSTISNSNNFKPIQKIAQTDAVEVQKNSNQISMIDNIEVSRRLRESDNNFSVVSKMPPSSSFLDESPQRESEAYRNFNQPLTQRLMKNSRQEKSPTTNVNVMQVVQQQSQQQQLDNQHPFQTPIQVQLNLPVQGSMTSNSNGPSIQNAPLVINISLPSMMMPPAQSTNVSTTSSTDTNEYRQSQPRISVQFSGTVQWHP